MSQSPVWLAVALFTIIHCALAPKVNAAEEDAINARLSRFAADPASVFDEALERWSDEGQPLRARPRFSLRAIESGAALNARDSDRARMCMEDHGKMICLGAPQSGRVEGREIIKGHDRPEHLVDGGAIGALTLEAMEWSGLRSSRLPIQPWSDDYWGFYKGILGARYADPAAISPHFRKNLNYVKARPASKIVASGDAKAIDALSPSEKYELLIGDPEGGLTSRMWRIGESYENSAGEVEDWMGICHGWAPAAFMMPRPVKSTVLKSADGKRDLKFYPSDIKALASLLWAHGDFSSRFTGGRCNKHKPKVDSNGRVTDEECFDTNPGSWHLAITQQIGAARRSFVFDASFDYEVWNQPVLGYSYQYFNPQSALLVKTLAEARVTKAQFTKDWFKKYRPANAVSFVGIVMDMTYVAETDPSNAATDGPSKDLLVTVRYFYDLELDAWGKVIGGEWHTNKHPDFLWVPTPGARARSVAEGDATGEWTGNGVIPASWRKAAIRAEQESQPLGKIVEMILKLAQ